MNFKNYRAPILHQPPSYYVHEDEKVMLAPITHKIKNKWDEENVVAHILANMQIVGRWFSSIRPKLYFGSGLHSGLLTTMSVPSKSVIFDMAFPGDIDILVIPYEENELLLSVIICGI